MIAARATEMSSSPRLTQPAVTTSSAGPSSASKLLDGCANQDLKAALQASIASLDDLLGQSSTSTAEDTATADADAHQGSPG